VSVDVMIAFVWQVVCSCKLGGCCNLSACAHALASGCASAANGVPAVVHAGGVQIEAAATS